MSRNKNKSKASLELLSIRHLWGTEDPEQTVREARSKGYSGIEFYPKEYPGDLTELAAICREQRLEVIAQVITEGANVDEHLRSFRAGIEAAEIFDLLSFNAHSGVDAFDDAQALRYFTEALKIQADAPAPVHHETHRGRILYNPWTTVRLLHELPELRLTADFSHFVNVCERLPHDLEPEFHLMAERSGHLHTRVGYEEGPQVPDPRAPEFAAHLKAHEIWWTWIWEAAIRRGDSSITATPEFGPPDYLHTLPYSREPVADLPEICDWMAQRNQEQFRAWQQQS